MNILNILKKRAIKSGIPYDDDPREGERLVNKFIHKLSEGSFDLLAQTHGDPISTLENETDISLSEYRDQGIFRHDFVCPAIKLFEGLEMAHALDCDNYDASKKYPFAINCPGYYNGVREFTRLIKEEQDPLLAKLRQLDPVEYLVQILSIKDRNSHGSLSVLRACPDEKIQIRLDVYEDSMNKGGE